MDMALIVGDREVGDQERLMDLEAYEFTALRQEFSKLRATLKHQVRRFDEYDLDRLRREGCPEMVEETYGDLEALYKKNDEIIDELGKEELRDLEGLYRLIQHQKLGIRCQSCCSGLQAACVIWDLRGAMHIIGNY